MELFNCKKLERSEDEWKNILNSLASSLEVFLQNKVSITSYTLTDYSAGQASLEVGADIVVNLGAQISLCGVIGYLVNYDEGVYISAYLLPFVNDTRLSSVDKTKEQLILSFLKDGKWRDDGWEIDEHYEWESYTDNFRWNKNA